MRGLLMLAVALWSAAAAAAPPAYWSEPHGTYESRRRDYLAFSASAKAGGLYSQVARLELRKPIDEKLVRASIATLNERRDGADFQANGLIRIYEHKGKLVSPALRKEIKDALLGLKYWVDEPGGKDLLSMWSENHQINYHAAEYLAGQLFPGEVFTNNKKKGAWHLETARRRVLRWIDIKARTGFNEWDSNNCYINTSAALMNLADLAKDKEVATRAAMILDIMFLDIAVDSFRGSYGTSHGRTYPGAITAGGATEDTTALQRIAWGMGAIGKPNNPAAVYLAASKKYRVAHAIEALAQAFPEEVTNKERQSLRIADAVKFNLHYDDPGDYFVVYAGGNLSNADYTERSLRITDALNVYRYGLVMKPYVTALLATYQQIAKGGQLPPDLDNSSLERVDKITYRTPDYQLSTAQDYRKGAPGSQQHIWQATLGPSTLVFTINPGGSSKYWQGRLPRNGQHKNVLVAIYDIPGERPPGPKTIFPPDATGDAVPSPAPSEETLDPRTLAVFRRSDFDEVVQDKNWTFGRKGKGYVALWSRTPVTWSAEVFGGEGLEAKSRRNVWVCLMGREKVDGPFAAWTTKVAEAPLESTPTSVKFGAPGLGDVEFGWDGPMKVAGNEIALGDYPRFDNPYVTTPWGTGRYEVSHRGKWLLLDFDKGLRKEGTGKAKKR